MLRATTACTFSFRISPDGSAPAALARRLFEPPEPQISGKTRCCATFTPFPAPASSFFWLFLFSDLLSSSLLFSSLTLPTSAFPSLHIVGSLTSKLPSNIPASGTLLWNCRIVCEVLPLERDHGEVNVRRLVTELDGLLSLLLLS